jgi:cobalt-zinc-cadmium efflux system membrane fusion protein
MKTLMKSKLTLFAMASVALAGCNHSNSDTHAESHASHEGHASEGGKPHKAESGHEGHDHHHNDASDLDRPLAELFAAACEHDLKTHECDECRYEVGVVKTDASLFDGGLLKKTKAEKRAVAAPLKLTGEVRFDDRRVAHVSTQAEGIIKAVHVTLGDKVKRGQALVEIESVAIGEAQAAYTSRRPECSSSPSITTLVWMPCARRASPPRRSCFRPDKISTPRGSAPMPRSASSNGSA